MASDEPRHPARDVRFLEQVRRDVEEWQSQHIITAEQGQQILDYYQVSAKVLLTGRTYARLVTVLAALGAVLMGTGAILFIASNWQAIPLYGKLALLIAAIIAANLGGYWLKYRGSYPRIGSTILFLASMLFGAGVFLTAQAYHVNANNPDLLFWWGLGVLPVAYAMRSRAMLVLALGIALVWPGWKIGPVFTAVYSVPATLAVYLALGTALYGLGALHSKSARAAALGLPYSGAGMLAVLGSLYFLSFKDIWTVFDLPVGPLWAADGFTPLAASIALATVAVAATATALVVGRRRGDPTGLLPYEGAALLVILGLAFFVLWNISLEPGARAALYNLALFGAIVATVVAGAMGRRSALVNLGVVVFAVDLFTRYVDLVWGFLDTSLFFALGGALLLGVGFILERARRRLLARYHLTETEQ